jgi:two-component sensor histidine kinase
MSRTSSIGGIRAFGGLATIATVPASAGQRKIAFRACIILLIIAVVSVPLANIQLGRNDYFVPFIHTLMFMTNLLTATFLFAQYSIHPQRALLFVAGGFVCGGLMALVHLLSFPSTTGSTVLVGDRLNSPTWLVYSWQTIFPLAVIVYALSKGKSEAADRSPRSMRIDIGVTVAAALMVAAALTCLASAAVVGYLPPLHEDVLRRTPFAMELSVLVAVVNLTALAVLFVHKRTLLDQWLMVTLFAWLPVLVMGSVFSSIRFSMVFYLSWVYVVITGSSLLLVMLIETFFAYWRFEEHQKLLIAELDHRVKNILAQVAAITASTRQASPSSKEFFQSLDGRIHSMATAHTLLSERGWQNIGLDAIVYKQLAPYMIGDNVTINGPNILLTSAQTHAIAMVLHELATNAAKYGALSVPAGQVSVSWDCSSKKHAVTLALVWRELGGPPVLSKVKASYGTDLICGLIPHELGGTVDLVFAAEGVNCRIQIPVR